jgi:hypothetical protein
MARVRADPVTTALAHPTRRAIYLALTHSDELSTVQIERQLGVDRYNLYHHMKKLASQVELPELLHASPSVQPPTTSPPTQASSEPIPDGLHDAVQHGGDVRVITLDGSRDQVGAKKMLELLAQQHGIPLDLPWNFLPESIVLIAKKR